MASAPPRVLLIEDNPGDIRLIREMLAEASEGTFQLEVAERLSEGLAYLAESQVDLVLLDLALPDSYGLETLFNVQTRTAGVPIIVLSVSEDEAMAVQAVQAGAQDYLVKGHLDGYLLVRSLRYAIERERAEDALRRAKAELEIRVQERTAELAAANDALRAEIAERQRAEERQRFLAEVGALLANSLDYEATLATLVRLAVPFLSDWCAVYSVTEAEPPHIMAVAYRDSAQEEVVWTIQGHEPPEPPRPHPVLQALHTGQPVLLPEVPHRHLQTISEEAQHVGLLPRLNPASYMAVPLVTRGRIVGVMTFGTAAGRRYAPGDLVLAEEVARRCALAVDNARLYQAAQDELARRTQAEAQIQASLREKEVLLKEIHHRVKNNLQIVSSLLNLQARAMDDPHLRAILHESRQRIQAMAYIHEALYQAHDLSRVPFATYVRRLTAQLSRVYDVAARRIRLTVQADPLDLDIDQAAACGLILHELLSNALTHAFPGGTSGSIDVALRRADHDIVLSVKDSGVGMPQALEVRHPSSLGLKLVSMLTNQLEGTLVLTQEGGTTFTLTAPLHPRGLTE